MSSSPTPTYGAFAPEGVAAIAGEEYGLLQLREGGVGHIAGSEARNLQLQIATKVASLFLGISLAAISVVVILNYPAATSELFAVYGSVAGLSLALLAILGAKEQRQRPSLPKPE